MQRKNFKEMMQSSSEGFKELGNLIVETLRSARAKKGWRAKGSIILQFFSGSSEQAKEVLEKLVAQKLVEKDLKASHLFEVMEDPDRDGSEKKMDWASRSWDRKRVFVNKHFRKDAVDRNLFIFIDGTNNDDKKANALTNVVFMQRAINEKLVADKKSIAQKAIYIPGVGSKEDTGNPISAIFKQIFGSGVQRLCNQAYLEILEKYRPGDRLFILGFSRGATVARMLANKLNDEGICERGAGWYQQSGIEDEQHLVSHHLSGASHKVKIEVLACWDTVAALGPIPVWILHFKKLLVPPCVNKAYHLVSVDENRLTFYPALMPLDERIEEIWFPGVHADVGGGYADRGLADITLVFMANRLKDEYKIDLSLGEQVTPFVEGRVHEHSATEIAAMGGEKNRKLKTKDSDQLPVVHKSVLKKTMMDSNNSRPYEPKPLAGLVEGKHYTVDDRD